MTVSVAMSRDFENSALTRKEFGVPKGAQDACVVLSVDGSERFFVYVEGSRDDFEAKAWDELSHVSDDVEWADAIFLGELGVDNVGARKKVRNGVEKILNDECVEVELRNGVTGKAAIVASVMRAYDDAVAAGVIAEPNLDDLVFVSS